MLVYMRELGITNQAAFNALGFATDFKTNEGEWVRLWGLLRDLEATGRKRPTWLGLELGNKAIQGDMLTTVQGGANPSWVQTPINDVETEIEVNYIQSFAFREDDSYSVILFNLSLDQAQQVRLALPAPPESQAIRYELTSASIHDDNEDAENVSIQTTQLTDFAVQYELTLPPHSVNVITWNAQPCYDFNESGQVDIVDIMLVASRWQMTSADPDWDPRYDLDASDRIDIVDIMLVAVNWGETC